MYEIIFLLILSSIWILFASIQDLKTREIANWLSFSLIIFALGFRFFYSLFFLESFSFFYQGLIGLGIFFALGNALYYGRMFAGGDAKLMIAFGAILPLYNDFLSNLKFFAVFFLIFMFVGAFYGLATIISLSFRNLEDFKKEFFKQFKKRKKIIFLPMSLALILMILGFFDNLFFMFGILIFILPYFYIYAKAVEETCMVKEINTRKLTEGDWLYKDVKIGKKLIKANWEGLTKNDIREIKKKYKKIKIKQGIPFSPVFLISFVILILLYFLKIDLWNSLW